MFEYKVIKCEYPKEMESAMNLYAKEGWEVVDTLFWRANWRAQIYITLKRKIKE